MSFRDQKKRVSLRIIRNLTLDLRSPKQQFKYRRWREQQKVPVAISMESR